MSDLYRTLDEIKLRQLVDGWAPELSGTTPEMLIDALGDANVAMRRDETGWVYITREAVLAFAEQRKISPPSWWKESSLARRIAALDPDGEIGRRAAANFFCPAPSPRAVPDASRQRLPGSTAPPKRKRGRRGAVKEQVVAKMKEMDRGELERMSEKEMEATFNAARSTCREARREAMALIGAN